MSAVLLVTGSRALDPRFDLCPGTLASEEWARTAIGTALIDVAPRGVVVAGDADGPDAWAFSLARLYSRRVRVFTRYGEIRTDTLDVSGKWFPSAPRPPPRDGWTARFLARNEAMVRDVAKFYDAADVHVLALHAPWARTHGTAHTVTMARDAGLRVEEHACPAVHAPRVPA